MTDVSGERESRSESVWYFAYGSNLDPDRFRARVGPWSRCRRATLADWRLRFSARVQSEGGGGAIIERSPGDIVHGAIFAIAPEQLAAMDAVELDPSRDTDAVGVRCAVRVDADGEALEAQAYSIDACGPGRAPSPRYLAHILRGLDAAGHDVAVVEAVRRAAEAEPKG